MFIQCRHCRTTYKIDENKIPDQDSFVRCAKCSNPIPLNKKEQSDLSQKRPQKIVECSNCGIRYSIPHEKIVKESIQVRCGKCSHVFQVSKLSADPEIPPEPLPDDSTSVFVDEADLPSPDTNDERKPYPADDEVDLDNISIPKESEIEVDSLFDDVDESAEQEIDSFDADVADSDDVEDGEHSAGFSKNATDEYLESVSLASDSEYEDEDMGIGGISSEQKAKIFLKPEAGIDSSDAADAAEPSENEDSWPEIQDETEASDLDEDLEDSGGGTDEEISELSEFDESTEFQEEDDSDTRDPLELQEMIEPKSRKWIVVPILLLSILAVLATVAWFYLKSDSRPAVFSPIIETYHKSSKLAILEPLKQRVIVNRNDRKKILVLEGTLRNNNPTNLKFGWIEVKGILYDQQNNVLSESTTFAGSNLTTSQLESWNREKIESFRSYQAGQVEQSLDLGYNQIVPFQIVFFDMPDNLSKLEARINRLVKNP